MNNNILSVKKNIDNNGYPNYFYLETLNLKNFRNQKKLKTLKNTDHMHFYSVYFGNNQFLTKDKIIKLCKNLDNLK